MRVGYRGAVVLLAILLKWPDAQAETCSISGKTYSLAVWVIWLVNLFYSTSGNLINLHTLLTHPAFIIIFSTLKESNFFNSKKLGKL